METKINQWLMLKDEIFDNDQNSMRYIDMLYYNVHHRDMRLYQNTVCQNGKTMDIMTIVTDNKEVYNEFCAMADNINGLYCVYTIMDNASKVLGAMSNQE